MKLHYQSDVIFMNVEKQRSTLGWVKKESNHPKMHSRKQKNATMCGLDIRCDKVIPKKKHTILLKILGSETQTQPGKVPMGTG